MIETGAGSDVVLMRPGTAALPKPLPFRARAGALGLHSCRALSSPPRKQYNPGIRIAGHGSTHQQLRVTNLNQDLTKDTGHGAGVRNQEPGDCKHGSSDNNKSLNVITADGPHELIRAEGPIHTSLAR